MSRMTVFVGGSVGSDPTSPRTWSGSCVRLLHALEEADLLDSAVGVKLPSLQNLWLRAKNVHPNRALWRARYYFDLSTRNALTRAAGRIPCSNDVLLQFGHMFSLPDAFAGRTCFSYHDGNLAEKLKSGFGKTGHSTGTLDAVLRYEEAVAGQMTAIFTFSQYLRQSFISDYHVPPERVFCVGGGINFASIPTVSPSKDYSIPRILFLGVEFERKGGRDLLKAFHQVRRSIPTAELHIVGPQAIGEIPAGVVFHGHLSKSNPAQREKLEALFRASSLFVLPSHYEPFGVAPLEAMLYQIPCVVTDAWAFKETVRSGINGERVPQGDVEALADTIIRLLRNPDSLAEMGNNGREIVQREYTWNAVASRLRQALKEISELSLLHVTHQHASLSG